MRTVVIVLTVAAIVLVPVTIYAALRRTPAPLVHVIYTPMGYADSFCTPARVVEASGRV